jgi:hypothetical protein
MTLLSRVYYNGVYVVAEFEKEGYIRTSDRKFVMNAENLEERIKNLEKLQVDTKEERKALDLIRSHKDYKP